MDTESSRNAGRRRGGAAPVEQHGRGAGGTPPGLRAPAVRALGARREVLHKGPEPPGGGAAWRWAGAARAAGVLPAAHSAGTAGRRRAAGYSPAGRVRSQPARPRQASRATSRSAVSLGMVPSLPIQ
ncbi:hypothetical protein GCM10027440_33410 [Nocardiopsis coralliicola]